MANSQGITAAFKQEAMSNLLDGKTQIKAALFYSSATIGPTTAAYAATGEVTGTNYSAKGVTVTNANSVAIGGTPAVIAYWSPSADIVYSNVTIGSAFDCVLLFDDQHASDLTIGAYTFGEVGSITAGNFTLTVPAHSSAAGLVRIN